jgi:hypothetical protein
VIHRSDVLRNLLKHRRLERLETHCFRGSAGHIRRLSSFDLRCLLVVSLVLLIAALLFSRSSLQKLLAIKLGSEARNVLVSSVSTAHTCVKNSCRNL